MIHRPDILRDRELAVAALQRSRGQRGPSPVAVGKAVMREVRPRTLYGAGQLTATLSAGTAQRALEKLQQAEATLTERGVRFGRTHRYVYLAALLQALQGGAERDEYAEGAGRHLKRRWREASVRAGTGTEHELASEGPRKASHATAGLSSQEELYGTK